MITERNAMASAGVIRNAATEPLSWRNPHIGGRIPELDGIRGLAILLVLIRHYAVDLISATPGSWLSYTIALFRLSWSGVDLFFVLSGFLIGGILLDARNSDRYYQTFYGRRIHRIFPVYFIWLALFLVGLYIPSSNGTSYLQPIFSHELPLWSLALFCQNVFMAMQSTFGPAWLGATWSLAVEEQFYLLLPFLVRNLTPQRVFRVVLVALICAPVFRMILFASGNTFFGPYTLLPCRADALGLGVLASLAVRNQAVWSWLAANRAKMFAAFVVLGCGVALLTSSLVGRLMPSIGYTWIAAFYASLLLLVLVNPGHMEKRIFRMPMLLKLGTTSYAIYIIHQGISWLYHGIAFGRPPSIHDWPSLFVTVLALGTTLALAAISWRVLEEPLLRRAHSKFRYDRPQVAVRNNDVAASV